METFALIVLIACALLTLGAIIKLNRKTNKIMATLQERFDAVNNKLKEASDEILAEIAKLKEGGNLTPEQEQSLENIEAKANALADVSPPVTPP